MALATMVVSVKGGGGEYECKWRGSMRFNVVGLKCSTLFFSFSFHLAYVAKFRLQMGRNEN